MSAMIIVTERDYIRLERKQVNHRSTLIPHVFRDEEQADDWRDAHRWIKWVSNRATGRFDLAIDHRGE